MKAPVNAKFIERSASLFFTVPTKIQPLPVGGLTREEKNEFWPRQSNRQKVKIIAREIATKLNNVVEKT